MKMTYTLDESTTVSKIFYDIETGKWLRVKGTQFVEIPNPNNEGPEKPEDPFNDQYDPDDPDNQIEQNDDFEEPEIIERDTFEFDDDDDEEEDTELDPEDPDPTKRPGVIVHNKRDNRDYVWNKKLKKYIRFK